MFLFVLSLLIAAHLLLMSCASLCPHLSLAFTQLQLVLADAERRLEDAAAREKEPIEFLSFEEAAEIEHY